MLLREYFRVCSFTNFSRYINPILLQCFLESILRKFLRNYSFRSASGSFTSQRLFEEFLMEWSWEALPYRWFSKEVDDKAFKSEIYWKICFNKLSMELTKKGWSSQIKCLRYFQKNFGNKFPNNFQRISENKSSNTFPNKLPKELLEKLPMDIPRNFCWNFKKKLLKKYP